jgi:protoheme ferro-lyase
MPRKAAEMVEAYLIRHHKFPLNRVRSYSADTEFVKMLADAIERSLKYHNDCGLATRMNPQSTAKKLEAKEAP